jgi:hypothetical protein
MLDKELTVKSASVCSTRVQDHAESGIRRIFETPRLGAQNRAPRPPAGYRDNNILARAVCVFVKREKRSMVEWDTAGHNLQRAFAAVVVGNNDERVRGGCGRPTTRRMVVVVVVGRLDHIVVDTFQCSNVVSHLATPFGGGCDDRTRQD